MSSRKYYYRRPIGDRHAWSETLRRPRHASSETDMPDQRPIRDLDMLHQRPTCLLGDPSETKMLHRRPIWNRHALLKNPPEIDMPDKSPYIIAKYINKKKYTKISIYLNTRVKIPIGLRRHAGLVWVSDQTCRSPMKHVEVSDQAFRSPMKHIEVSHQECWSPMGLR